MHSKKINPIIQWWVTPKLPYQDIFGLPLLMKKGRFEIFKYSLSRWLIHPIKRRLARTYLAFLRKYSNIKVIGVTGSAGKSTTVRIISTILSMNGKTYSTPPSIDPIYNVPNTILNTPFGTRYLVLEFSVEYVGEMDYYLWLARPDVGVITNIFPTHLEFLRDVEGVFQEKSKLVYALSSKGVAVLNKDDKKLNGLSGQLKSKISWFASNVDPFKQNENAAISCVRNLGVKYSDIKKGLASYKNPPHRLELVDGKGGIKILDDSYNSNPWAAISTLKYFNRLAAKNKKVAVLGDMLELGSFDEEAHRLLGKEIAKSKFDLVVGVGKSSRFLIEEVKKLSNAKTILVRTSNEALPFVKDKFGSGTFILVKGSRSIGLDSVVRSLS